MNDASHLTARAARANPVAADLLEVEKRSQQQAGWLLAATVAVMNVIAEFQYAEAQAAFRQFSIALSGTLLVWFIGSAMLIRAGYYRPWFKYVNVVVQVSTVTFFLMVSARLLGTEFALSSSAPVLYVLIIGITSLTLNPLLSLLAGGFAAGQFMGAYAFWLHSGGVEKYLLLPGTNTGWTSVGIKAVIFLAMGIAAMLMARRARALLERVMAQVRAEEQLRAIESDMERAAEIQERLIPRDPAVPATLAVETYYCPSGQVGGDYFDVISEDDARCVIVVADVSGKGYSAALTMANIQAMVRVLISSGQDLEQLVRTLNRTVTQSSVRGGFVSFVVMEIRPAQHVLRYVNCGHNPPLVTDKTGEVYLAQAGGPVLGVVEELAVVAETVPFAPGAQLVAYTDGLTELKDRHGRELGEAPLSRLLAEAAGSDPARLKAQVLAAVEGHLDGASPRDDLSFVCLGYR